MSCRPPLAAIRKDSAGTGHSRVAFASILSADRPWDGVTANAVPSVRAKPNSAMRRTANRGMPAPPAVELVLGTKDICPHLKSLTLALRWNEARPNCVRNGNE